MNQTKKRRFSPLPAIALVFAVSIIGCSSSEPSSVTDGIEQSEIEAYKEQERQIELDAMNDMELE